MRTGKISSCLFMTAAYIGIHQNQLPIKHEGETASDTSRLPASTYAGWLASALLACSSW
jgi:hypothetical protein